MKIEIYGEATRKEEVLRLRLVPALAFMGGVTVVAVDTAGETISRGNLLTIKDDGTVYFHECINKDLGLELDNARRLKIAG